MLFRSHMACIVQRANDKLADLIENNLELDGMGTTFSGAAFSGTMLGVAHIGDSRGYLLREGELKQLTHDHSWVQSLIDEGRITPEQAATHPAPLADPEGPQRGRGHGPGFLRTAGVGGRPGAVLLRWPVRPDERG